GEAGQTGRQRGKNRAMNDRRQLGTGPTPADLSRTRDTELPPAPRAQLAAERLPANPAAPDPRPARPATGHRALGTGPAPAGPHGCDRARDRAL
ncbi:hypothetical protein ACIPW1_34145, partial [Streptomyces nodosus]